MAHIFMRNRIVMPFTKIICTQIYKRKTFILSKNRLFCFMCFPKKLQFFLKYNMLFHRDSIVVESSRGVVDRGQGLLRRVL